MTLSCETLANILHKYIYKYIITPKADFECWKQLGRKVYSLYLFSCETLANILADFECWKQLGRKVYSLYLFCHEYILPFAGHIYLYFAIFRFIY